MNRTINSEKVQGHELVFSLPFYSVHVCACMCVHTCVHTVFGFCTLYLYSVFANLELFLLLLHL